MDNSNSFQGAGTFQNNIAPQGIRQQPQPMPGYGPQSQIPPNQAVAAKSSVTAGILGLFLGGVGAHCFYLGYNRLAIAHLAVGGSGILLITIGSLLPFAFIGAGSLDGAIWSTILMPAIVGIGWLLMIGSGIWGLIESIMCLSKNGKFAHDADGVPLV